MIYINKNLKYFVSRVCLNDTMNISGLDAGLDAGLDILLVHRIY